MRTPPTPEFRANQVAPSEKARRAAAEISTPRGTPCVWTCAAWFIPLSSSSSERRDAARLGGFYGRARGSGGRLPRSFRERAAERVGDFAGARDTTQRRFRF